MTTPARLIAFGDIHGCDAALAALLEAIEPTANDRLVFLGDYIDRGPESRQVVDRLIGLRETLGAVTILGNHEEMMLRALRGQSPLRWWTMHGGEETLDSYGYTGDLTVVPLEHVAFMDSCVAWHEEAGFLFFHANYVADEPLDQQPAEALRWQSLYEHLPARHESGATAIVGHTAQKSGEVLDAGHLKCLDTHCYGGGWLTAMDVLTGRLWQADRHGGLRLDE
ncbi:MAG: metallophosphoesterase [Planctomycetota bacterium]